MDYILIGGVAATLHGSNLRTGDVDICPNRSATNLERLADALNAMHARIRTGDAPDGVRLRCDAAFLERAETWNLATDFGGFGISFHPTGTEGSRTCVANVFFLNWPASASRRPRSTT